MTLSTAFTRLFGIQHPIALAPMGGFAGGALAAAVSSGGGLGLVGGGNGDAGWLARELPIAAQGTSRPWGVGFQSWAVDAGTVERALQMRPSAVMLSFGDPRPFAGLVRRAGAALILQVTDLEEARQAVDLGADVIVAQGTESGGHGARQGRSTLSFVPVVADLAAPIPGPSRRSSKDAGTTPSAAESSTSPAAPGGRRSTPPVPSATHSWTSGGAGKAN
jgi:nitronate monooxygenase